MKIGYTLSSEEHGPEALVRYAAKAEEVGFDFAVASDHFHPWTDRQGQSPFVWSVLGAVAKTTTKLRLGTGVTCPLIRMHPAIVAHAAATTAALMPGRFFLGVGTGENLNEHITGARWPAIGQRLRMLEEAIDVMRRLWGGATVSYEGEFYEVQQARIYSLPEQPPPIYVAAAGPKAVALAATAGDGLIATKPDPQITTRFAEEGGQGKPRYGQITVCYADTEERARRTAKEWWPNAALSGELGQELPLPRHFEQAAELVREDDVAEVVNCGPDPDRHIEAIRRYADAGYDHMWVHQVGPEQESFLEFYGLKVLPELQQA